jgi:RNA-directed DNA polymerase
MTKPTEERPASVPATAQQAGDALSRWDWVEHAVWTDRMLTALDEGVKGQVWFRLIDKVFSERNLYAAYAKVARNDGAPGVDHITVEEFGSQLDANLKKLSEDLRTGAYRPQLIRRTEIPKPGTKEKRPLGIPTVRDRVVQAAVVHVIEPIFEKEFATHSYGFRPGLGCKDALRRVNELLQKGYVYVVDADLKSYFDTIPHEPLLARLRERIADGRVLSLIEQFLHAGILTDVGIIDPEAGAPQGAVLSPLLSNIYLNPLDQQMSAQGFQMVRYADDFVILCRSAEEAEQALGVVQEWTAQAGLTLHPTKTRVVDARQDGFDFLGYRFKPVQDGRILHFPRKKSLQKMKEAVRKKTHRSNGHSLCVIIRDVNTTLRGWFHYFQHSYRTTFRELDSWIKMRVRSVLRKRAGGRGPGRGSDHSKWENAFFAKRGLFNLQAAHKLAAQSCLR